MLTPIYIDGIHAADLDQSGPHTLIVSKTWPQRVNQHGRPDGQRIPVGRVVSLAGTDDDVHRHAASIGQDRMGPTEFQAWAESVLRAIPRA